LGAWTAFIFDAGIVLPHEFWLVEMLLTNGAQQQNKMNQAMTRTQFQFMDVAALRESLLDARLRIARAACRPSLHC
jgi:hypothetical protein